MKPVADGWITDTIRRASNGIKLVCRVMWIYSTEELTDLALNNRLLDLLDLHLAETFDFEQCFASCSMHRLSVHLSAILPHHLESYK